MRRLLAILLLAVVLTLCTGCSVYENLYKTDYKAEVTEYAMIAESDDLSILDSYPNLTYVDLRGSTCYDAILAYTQSHPNVEVRFNIELGQKRFNQDETEISLNGYEADYEMLLRVPGIGVKGAKRIVRARRTQKLDFDALKRLGIVLKRAKFFVTCNGKTLQKLPETTESMLWAITSPNNMGGFTDYGMEQLSLFQPVLKGEDVMECLTGEF